CLGGVIDKNPGTLEDARIELLFPGSVGTDSVDMGSFTDPFVPDDRLAGRCRGNKDVGVTYFLERGNSAVKAAVLPAECNCILLVPAPDLYRCHPAFGCNGIELGCSLAAPAGQPKRNGA